MRKVYKVLEFFEILKIFEIKYYKFKMERILKEQPEINLVICIKVNINNFLFYNYDTKN